MPKRFDPRLDILPIAQKELWPHLSAAPQLSFVLYGGTAVALHLGHRQSVDFDFFRSAPLNKAELQARFAFLSNATIQVLDVPEVVVTSGSLAVPLAEPPSAH
jgi:hypothetical protein